MTFEECVKAFAAERGGEQLVGLVIHRPAAWARPLRCLENVWEKIEKDGGLLVTGWYFSPRERPGIGPYVIATHHAVWADLDGSLLDVTPQHEDPQLRPFSVDGSVLFLFDPSAEPLENDRCVSVLPSRFLPLTDDTRLLQYLEDLRAEEESKCLEIFERRLGQ